MKPISHSPSICIGLPVRNGARYLRQALESILAQSHDDFRLLISDNASTDTTAEICREYADRDPRIRYFRQGHNIGASLNFNRVFQPGDAPYFKWAAHDDVLLPDYLRRCVELLEHDPGLAIAHSRSLRIDADGRVIGDYDDELRLAAARPSERFRRMLWVDHFTEVFGLMRSRLIARTRLYGGHGGADRHFMAEMVLQGDVGYVEARLFLRRQHPESFCDALNDNAARLKWFDPLARSPATLTAPIKLQHYLISLLRLPLPASERAACLAYVMAWATRRGLETAVGDSVRHLPCIQEPSISPRKDDVS